MKRIPSRPSKSCNAILGISSGIHLISGLAVIVFQILLIHANSLYHDIGGGLWAGPVFFIQGVLGFICLCDVLMCSVVSFLVSSVIGALLTVALAAVAAVDLGSISKCPKEDYRSSPFYPGYCYPSYAPQIVQASWGIIITSCIQLVASACSIYICMTIIYSTDSSPTQTMSNPYLYDEIPSPHQTRFRGSLQSAQEKVQTFRNKSTYSLNSTLPVRRSKSMDRFSEDNDSFSDQNMIMYSTNSINVVPSGTRYKKSSAKVSNANSMYNVMYPSVPPIRIAPRPPSTRSLNLQGELPGHMKHTAV